MIEVAHADPRLHARAFAVAVFLFAIYWLSASGAFHSIDEHAVFAVARNLVLHGGVDESALFWGVPYGEHARVGLDSELYAKYGIGHSLLTALAVGAGRAIPGAGLASTATLLGSLATGLTASLLALAAGRLGYSTGASTAAALLYGLATIAWPYAKTMFSEPLVALGWMAVVWVLLGNASWHRALAAGAITAAVVLVRPATAVVGLPLVLLLWSRRPRALLERLAAFGAPVAAAVIGVLAFNWWRFGDPFQFGYTERLDGSLITGLIGFLFSLDRSIFLFAPPLIGLIWSAPAFIRRHGTLGWKLLTVAACSLTFYSVWPAFWGGPVWGPRYLLPIMPLLSLLLLPLIDRAIDRNGPARWALVLLAAAGAAMQLPAVIWNSLPATQTLGQRYPLWLLRPRADWLDLAWLYPPEAGRSLPLWEGAAVALGLAAAAAAAWLRPQKRYLGAAGALAAIAFVATAHWLGASGLGYGYRPAFSSAVSLIESEGRKGDALVLNPAPYQSPVQQLTWFLNSNRLAAPVFGVYREGPDTLAMTPRRLQHLLERYERVWLLTEGLEPGNPQSTAERWLVDASAVVKSEWLEDGFRLSLFEARRPPSHAGTPGVALGEVAVLESWQIAWNPGASATVQIQLRWRAIRSGPGGLHTFVQLLDSEGRALAGWDGVPRAGFQPADTWQTGTSVEETMVLAVPEDRSESGQLRVIAGLYDSATGQRSLAPDGSDFVPLALLESHGE